VIRGFASSSDQEAFFKKFLDNLQKLFSKINFVFIQKLFKKQYFRY